MFFRVTKKIQIFGGLLALATFLFPFHAYTATNQAQAQAEAELLHRKAADISMQNSTTSAMTALMELASLNIGGAVTNGYKAYGSYRNSEELDLNADLDNYLKNKMQSSNGAFNGAVQGGAASATSKSSGLTVTDTSFSRLNSSFMRSGKTAEVASEFEKRSGMSRDEFLKNLAVASENKISVNDPQMMDKIVSRFENFVAKIPNADFRSNLEKGISMIPQTARSGLVAQAIQKAASFVGDSGGAEMAAALKAPSAKAPEVKAVAAANIVAPPTVASSGESPASNIERAPSSAPAPKEKVENAGFFIGLEKDSTDPLGSIIQAAADAQKEETIFSQVTRRYRLVTPLLVSKTP